MKVIVVAFFLCTIFSTSTAWTEASNDAIPEMTHPKSVSLVRRVKRSDDFHGTAPPPLTIAIPTNEDDLLAFVDSGVNGQSHSGGHFGGQVKSIDFDKEALNTVPYDIDES